MAAPTHASGAFHGLVHPGGRSLHHFGQELFQSISDDDIFGRAAQLAYYFFFAIFPGFIFLTSLAGLITGGGGMSASLVQHLATVVPPDAFNILQETFAKAGHGAGRLTFGAVVALWSATVGMSAACDTLNGVHDVRESRPWWKVRLTALILTSISSVLLLCAMGDLFLGDALVRAAAHGSLPWALQLLIKIAQWAVAFVLIALIFGITYYWAPDVREREWHWITPGAAVGIVLWVLASLALRLYLHFFNSYSVTFGTVGAVMILLLWFYIAGLALLIGAEINAVIEDTAAHDGDPRATAKGQKGPAQAA